MEDLQRDSKDCWKMWRCGVRGWNWSQSTSNWRKLSKFCLALSRLGSVGFYSVRYFLDDDAGKVDMVPSLLALMIENDLGLKTV